MKTEKMHIRVVSPSNSIHQIGGFEANRPALIRLNQLGFHVSFSSHYDETDIMHSASITSRVEDIHEAFLDSDVDIVLSTIGGFNSNELLPYLDYALIKKSPKIFCGYSDTTALLNGIYAQTNLITYMGPSYSSFKMDVLQEYQTESWLEAITTAHYQLKPSMQWSSDAWFLPNAERHLKPTRWKVYQAGEGQGTIIGGNLSTFTLLTGTPYAPKPNQYILFIECSEETSYQDFNRQLAALLQVYPHPAGLMIGRFPKEIGMTHTLLMYILDKHPVLKTIPVMYDLDFAHTQPLFTLPIGATVKINTSTQEILIEK